MLVLSKGGLSASQAETYYQEQYTHDDYYSEQQSIVGQWCGKGATELGLQDDVTPEQFKAILNGHNPNTGSVLVPEHNSKHRAGWDATFNAPKSISLQALVGGDERLLAAHRQAVQKALTELEGYTQSRVEGGTRRVFTGNMVAAQFEHTAARPSRSGKEQGIGPDPHLHTHVVIANMTKRDDGQWRGVEPLDLYRSQAFATAVYRSELARSARGLGYDVSLTGERGEWELAGYSRAHIEAFSHRRQDITKQLAEQGRSSSAAAQIAAHQTRLPKGQQTEAEMKQEWQERARGLGLDLPERTIEAKVRESELIPEKEQRAVAWTAVTYAHEHLTERDAAMHERTLEMTALQRGMGTLVLDNVRSEISQQTERGVLQVVTQGPWAGKGYTTQEMMHLEQDNLSLWQTGQGQAQSLVDASDVHAWGQQKGLSAEQTQVLTQTLTSRDWLSSIEGKAGAAKTTTVGAMRELLEKRGHVVYGFGPTTGSVRALQDAGVEARTVASLLAQPVTPNAQKGGIWVIDESSLLATRQVNTLLHKALDAQVARVIFVGDQRQHGAIEAGRPIAQLQEAGMETARLDTIRRQRDPELLEAVQAAAKGNMKESVNMLVSQKRVKEIADTQQRYNSIAVEYGHSVAAGMNTLVVSPANTERTAINTAIRHELQMRNRLPKEGINHQVLISRSLTKAEQRWAGNYQIGDVIKYRTGSKKLGIEPGEYGEIINVEAWQNRITIGTEAGVIHTYSPAKLRAVEVFREESRELAIGERIQFRTPLKEHKIPNGAFGKIESIENEEVTVKLDTGKPFTATIKDLRHIEYGYASTSHSSQGQTVDKVLINVDTEQSVALVNSKQFYVSISRARDDAQVFTNSREELPHAISRSWPKTTAVESVAPPKIEAPEQKVERSRGMRWGR